MLFWSGTVKRKFLISKKYTSLLLESPRKWPKCPRPRIRIVVWLSFLWIMWKKLWATWIFLWKLALMFSARKSKKLSRKSVKKTQKCNIHLFLIKKIYNSGAQGRKSKIINFCLLYEGGKNNFFKKWGLLVWILICVFLNIPSFLEIMMSDNSNIEQ